VWTIRRDLVVALLMLLLLPQARAAVVTADPDVWTPETADRLRAAVMTAGDEGLDPRAIMLMDPTVRSLSPQERARYAADTWLRLGRALVGFGVDPTTFHERWLAPVPQDPAPALLAALEAGEDPVDAVEALRPTGADYRDLVRVLGRLRAQQAVGGWPLLPEGPVLHPGERGPEVRALRTRLAWEAPLPPVERDHDFDEGLAAALRAYQARCGLAADGVLGPATRAALDVPVADRIEQVRLNLTRLRAAERPGSGREVRVNIAAQELEVRRGDDVLLAMRTVVGRPDRPTPVLSGLMTSVELHPYWNIPQKLARRDVLPKVKQDPSFLTERGIRVYASWDPGAPEIDPATVMWDLVRPWNLAYKLRQDPGPQNPLGPVKFLFPNAASVYLHGTPARDDFRRPVRAASSGCVRVEDPVALAACLLGDAKVGARVAEGRHRSLALAEPVPVRLVYLTAWTDRDGAVHYRDDLYGHDAPLREALARLEREGLPGAEWARVEMDEAGTRVVAHAAAVERAGGAAEALQIHAGQAHVHGAAGEVEAVLGHAAAGPAQGLVGGR